MKPIIKTFTGINLDLSTVIAISDAQFDPFNRNNGFGVYFDIYCANRPEPFRYERDFTPDEKQAHADVTDYFTIIRVDNTFQHCHHGEQTNQADMLAVARLQAQIDDLIEQWRNA